MPHNKKILPKTECSMANNNAVNPTAATKK